MTVERGSRSERVAYLLLIGMAVCFGGAWVPAVWAVDEAPPFTIAAVRFGLASLLLFAWARVGRQQLSAFSRRDLPLVIGLGLTAIAGYNWLFLTGLTLAPASDGAIIVPGLAPVFTTILAIVLLREQIGVPAGIGLLAAAAGLVLVIGPSGSTDAARLVGDLLFVAGAACWGLYGILARVASRRFNAVSAILYATLCGTLVLIPLALLEGGLTALAGASPRAWFGMVYLAIFASVLAFVFLQVGVSRIGAARASAFALLVPVIGVLSSAALLGEELTLLTLLGGAVVLGGLWLIQQRPAPRAARGEPVTAPD